MDFNNRLLPWSPRVLSILRMASALLFMQHGTMKILDYPPTGNYDDMQLISLTGVAGILELFGGALLLVGLFTRPVAFILSGMMAVAYFLAPFMRLLPSARKCWKLQTEMTPPGNGGEAKLSCQRN